MILRILSILGLTELTLHPKTGVILESNNLTILNLFLLRLGPMNEKRLVQVLMSTQVTIFPGDIGCPGAEQIDRRPEVFLLL